jgi:hypothetical protein
MHAADYAISIALNNESELIALNVQIPYFTSSIILAPTFGSEKYMEEEDS